MNVLEVVLKILSSRESFTKNDILLYHNYFYDYCCGNLQNTSILHDIITEQLKKYQYLFDPSFTVYSFKNLPIELINLSIVTNYARRYFKEDPFKYYHLEPVNNNVHLIKSIENII
jgi:hypothetical protein